MSTKAIYQPHGSPCISSFDSDLLVRVEDGRADLGVLPRRSGELAEQVVVPVKCGLVIMHKV